VAKLGHSVGMHPNLAAVATSQGGVFAAWQAREHGYSAKEIQQLVRSGDWVARRRGIYAERAVVEAADAKARYALDVAAALVAIRRAGEDARLVASHLSAAALWPLETLDAPVPAAVRLTTSSRRIQRMSPGLQVGTAALPDEHVTRCKELPITTKARTVVDVARESSYRAGVVLADSALRSGVTKPELEQVLRDCWNWPGIRQAARVVEFADPRPESVAESLARVVVVELGFPVPTPQVRIRDGLGFIGRVDLLFEEQRTILEVDGKKKYVERERDEDEVLWREKKREDRLRDAGYEVVRVTWAELMYHPERVRAKLLAAFARAQRRWAR